MENEKLMGFHLEQRRYELFDDFYWGASWVWHVLWISINWHIWYDFLWFFTRRPMEDEMFYKLASWRVWRLIVFGSKCFLFHHIQFIKFLGFFSLLYFGTIESLHLVSAKIVNCVLLIRNHILILQDGEIGEKKNTHL